MNYSRRQFLAGTAATTAFLTTGCASSYGHRSSYLSQILGPQNQNTVYHWVDIVLQQVRDQRVLAPRAAYNYALPMAAGFLAANGIVRAYDEPFGIGAGPSGADPEVAFGSAFAVAAAEAFQQPFVFERLAFMNRFPAAKPSPWALNGVAPSAFKWSRCAPMTAPSPAKPLITSAVINGARIRCAGVPPARSMEPGRVRHLLLSTAACIPAMATSSPGP